MKNKKIHKSLIFLIALHCSLSSRIIIARHIHPIASQLQLVQDIKFEQGDGKINGETFAVMSNFSEISSDQLYAKLVQHLSGKYTVTRHQTNFSEIFILANLRSNQCPKCTSPTPENAATIVANSYTISIFNIGSGGSFALGTPSQAVMNSSLKKPAIYHGEILKQALTKLSLDLQAEFRFNRSYAHQTTGLLSGDLQTSKDLLRADLERAGYKEFVSNYPTDQNRRIDSPSYSASTWIKRKSTVYLTLSNTSDQTTKMGLYEIITE